MALPNKCTSNPTTPTLLVEKTKQARTYLEETQIQVKEARKRESDAQKMM